MIFILTNIIKKMLINNINEIYELYKSDDNLYKFKEKFKSLELEQKKELLNYQNKDSLPILILACVNNDLDLFEYLINEGADSNIKVIYQHILNINTNRICCNKGSSILHIACKLNNLSFVKFIVNNKGNINITDDYNATPLHSICYHFNDVINNNKINKYKKEYFNNILQIIKFLLKNGADPNIATFLQKKNTFTYNYR